MYLDARFLLLTHAVFCSFLASEGSQDGVNIFVGDGARMVGNAVLFMRRSMSQKPDPTSGLLDGDTEGRDTIAAAAPGLSTSSDAARSAGFDVNVTACRRALQESFFAEQLVTGHLAAMNSVQLSSTSTRSSQDACVESCNHKVPLATALGSLFQIAWRSLGGFKQNSTVISRSSSYKFDNIFSSDHGCAQIENNVSFVCGQSGELSMYNSLLICLHSAEPTDDTVIMERLVNMTNAIQSLIERLSVRASQVQLGSGGSGDSGSGIFDNSTQSSGFATTLASTIIERLNASLCPSRRLGDLSRALLEKLKALKCKRKLTAKSVSVFDFLNDCVSLSTILSRSLNESLSFLAFVNNLAQVQKKADLVQGAFLPTSAISPSSSISTAVCLNMTSGFGTREAKSAEQSRFPWGKHCHFDNTTDELQRKLLAEAFCGCEQLRGIEHFSELVNVFLGKSESSFFTALMNSTCPDEGSSFLNDPCLKEYKKWQETRKLGCPAFFFNLSCPLPHYARTMVEGHWEAEVQGTLHTVLASVLKEKKLGGVVEFSKFKPFFPCGLTCGPGVIGLEDVYMPAAWSVAFFLEAVWVVLYFCVVLKFYKKRKSVQFSLFHQLHLVLQLPKVAGIFVGWAIEGLYWNKRPWCYEDGTLLHGESESTATLLCTVKGRLEYASVHVWICALVFAAVFWYWTVKGLAEGSFRRMQSLRDILSRVLFQPSSNKAYVAGAFLLLVANVWLFMRLSAVLVINEKYLGNILQRSCSPQPNGAFLALYLPIVAMYLPSMVFLLASGLEIRKAVVIFKQMGQNVRRRQSNDRMKHLEQIQTRQYILVVLTLAFLVVFTPLFVIYYRYSQRSEQDDLKSFLRCNLLSSSQHRCERLPTRHMWIEIWIGWVLQQATSIAMTILLAWAWKDYS